MMNEALSYALVIVSFALTLVTLIMALGRKERHLRVYASGFAFSTACFILYPLQQGPIGSVAIVLSNLFLMVFHVCMLLGIRAFYELKPVIPRRLWVYFGLYLALIVSFTYVHPSFTIRASITSAIIVLVVGEFLRTLMRHSYDTVSMIRTPIIVCFALAALFHATRFVLLATGRFADTVVVFDNPITSVTIAFTIFVTILWSGGILLLDNAKLVSDLIKKNMMLENLALKDELTGLFNRHSLDQTIVAEMQRQNRYQEPVSLIMLDLDHFKAVNDRFGHDAGDIVLVEAARRVLRGIRSTDFLFRWGGEEFLILMPNTNLEGASLVAEKLRCALLGAPIDPVGTITASFGVAERKPGESREDWFRHVDQAMYRAKRGGRNKVELWKPGNDMPVAATRVEWQKEWDSGVKSIDQEHRDIIAHGNALLSSATEKKKKADVNKTIESLIAVIQGHFTSEESIIKAVGYPDAEHHCQIHRAIYAEAREMQESYVKGKTDAPILFDFIVHKLILDHILTTDVLYYPYIRGKQNGKQDRT